MAKIDGSVQVCGTIVSDRRKTDQTGGSGEPVFDVQPGCGIFITSPSADNPRILQVNANFYPLSVCDSEGIVAVSPTEKLTFNRDSGFYLTKTSDPNEVMVNFSQDFFTGLLLDVDETNPDGTSFIDVSRLRFNQGDGFYLSPDSSGNPVVNFVPRSVLTVMESNPDGDSFSQVTKINFNQASGFYLTQDSLGNPVVNQISARDLTIMESNPDGDSFEAITKINVNQADGFYLTSDSFGNPVLNLTVQQRQCKARFFGASMEWIFDHDFDTRPVQWHIFDDQFRWIMPDTASVGNPNTAFFYFCSSRPGYALICDTGLNL